MPSYDKEKLLRLMQERHVGFLASRDLMDRQNDVRKQIAHLTQNIRNNAAHQGTTDFIEMLLEKPLKDALTLSRNQVEYFQRAAHTRIGSHERAYASGISYAMWGDLNQARLRLERLSNQLERHRETTEERYAILPKLKDAVLDWGFSNPDREL